MKIRLILSIFLLCAGMLWAQDKSAAILPSDAVIQNYMSSTQAYAALFSGKTEMPYDVTFTNHPYFETDRYVSGTLCYNRVVYKDILMRIDLFRDELTVICPDVPYRIVLNNDKFHYAVLNSSTIIKSVDEKNPKTKFLVLLHAGNYPVLKKYAVRIAVNHPSPRVLTRTFLFQNQYAIDVEGILHTVKNKNSILKLFPDRKKELNEYAKLHKLNFRKQPEQSIIALVNHYDTIKE